MYALWVLVKNGDYFSGGKDSLWKFLHSVLFWKSLGLFFIQSAVDGHLGGFHVVAVVKNPAMNVECRYRFEIPISIFWIFTQK